MPLARPETLLILRWQTSMSVGQSPVLPMLTWAQVDEGTIPLQLPTEAFLPMRLYLPTVVR
jgi:hypothetical protein